MIVLPSGKTNFFGREQVMPNVFEYFDSPSTPAQNCVPIEPIQSCVQDYSLIQFTQLQQDNLCLRNELGWKIQELERLQRQNKEFSRKMSNELQRPAVIVQGPQGLFLLEKNGHRTIPFSNGMITGAKTIIYSPAFGKANAYVFDVSLLSGEKYSVEISEAEFNPKSVLKLFQTKGHMPFWGKQTSTMKGELLCNFLICLLTHTNSQVSIFYHNGWQYQSESSEMSYLFSTESHVPDYSYPLGWKSFPGVLSHGIEVLGTLFSAYEDPKIPLMLSLWLHYGILHTFFDLENIEISQPLYLIGKDSIKIAQSILQIFDCRVPHIIPIWEKRKNIEKILFDAKDEVLLFQDTDDPAKQYKRDNNFSFLMQVIQKKQSIIRNNMQRPLHAVVAICGTHYPESTEEILFLEVEEGGVNSQKLLQLMQHSSAFPNMFVDSSDRLKQINNGCAHD